MAANRIGLLQVQVNGEVFRAKGGWTLTLGTPTGEPVVGADELHGIKITPGVPMIEGEITDSKELDLRAILTLVDGTVTATLRNGKTFVLSDATQTSAGGLSTEEGNIEVQFIGKTANEV